MMPVAALAQASGGTTFAATAEAVVNDRLSLIVADQLDFGRMATGSNGGTVIVSPNGVRSLGAGSTVILAGGNVSKGKFDGYGRRNQQVRVSITATPITITRTNAPPVPGPLDQMTVSNFVLGIDANSGAAIIGAGGGSPRLRITRTNGLFSFNIGATLTVKANQTGGLYKGTYELTAVYN